MEQVPLAPLGFAPPWTRVSVHATHLRGRHGNKCGSFSGIGASPQVSHSTMFTEENMAPEIDVIILWSIRCSLIWPVWVPPAKAHHWIHGWINPAVLNLWAADQYRSAGLKVRGHTWRINDLHYLVLFMIWNWSFILKKLPSCVEIVQLGASESWNSHR